MGILQVVLKSGPVCKVAGRSEPRAGFPPAPVETLQQRSEKSTIKTYLNKNTFIYGTSFVILYVHDEALYFLPIPDSHDF